MKVKDVALDVRFTVSGYLTQLRHRIARHGPRAPVVDLNRLDQLRAAFNEAAGTPRLVLLFAPT